jgi:peptidoglycan/xylan/chitin deacetylase (PgdA/CDA1 family)
MRTCYESHAMRTLLLLAAVGCNGRALVAPPDSASGVDVRTIVSLTFDDVLADQAQLGPMLAAHGMHATFYVNSGRIGLAGHMTQDELVELAHAGHEIAGHTLTHPHLPSLTLADRRMEICDDRTALLSAGFEATSFAYPFGDSNAMTEQIVLECGYSSARGVGDLVGIGSCQSCPPANRVPPVDPFNIATHSSVKSDDSLATIESYVTEAEATGGWVPIVFHHICDDCDDYAISATTLAPFLDWLEARRDAGTVVETVADVISPLR